VVGARFALVEAGLAQFVYLILFSYSFFFKGYTGLIITIASIVTLFMVMQLTGRIDWEEKFKTISQKNTAGPKP
jgi:VIT1/CCC1 family predicted Fe2+/Mn2+ transporter